MSRGMNVACPILSCDWHSGARAGDPRPLKQPQWWAHFEFTRINIEPIILKNKIEDVREAGAVIAAREWTSHDVESTIADVGPFPSIRTQGTIESTREARSAGRKPPEPPACIP